MKKIFLLSFLLLGFADSIKSQNDLQKFVGTWEITENANDFKKIKISNVDGSLQIQMKTNGGIKQAKAKVENNKSISWSYVDKENYGEWWIGYWNGEADNILVGHGNGSYGTNGKASNITSRSGKANKEVEIVEFIAELDNDILILKCRYSGNYYGNQYNQSYGVLFSQHSNFFHYADYTNW